MLERADVNRGVELQDILRRLLDDVAELRGDHEPDSESVAAEAVGPYAELYAAEHALKEAKYFLERYTIQGKTRAAHLTP
jgi:hypothetical protein